MTNVVELGMISAPFRRPNPSLLGPAQLKVPARSFRRQAARVAGAFGNPTLKLTFGFEALGVDAQPAPGFATGHHHRAHVGAFQQLFGVLRRHPHHQPTLAAGGYRHVAVDQEREAAEHAFLLDALLAANKFADPVGQVFVIGHAATLMPATDTRRGLSPDPLERSAGRWPSREQPRS